MSKKRAKIRRGMNPKRILRQMGIKYDGASFAPELPDYLGYVVTFVLIWLVYTGYNSAVAVITDPNSQVSKYTKQAKEVADDALTQTGVKSAADSFLKGDGVAKVDAARARLGAIGTTPEVGIQPEEESPRKKGYLVWLNEKISLWADQAVRGSQELLYGEEDEADVIDVDPVPLDLPDARERFRPESF